MNKDKQKKGTSVKPVPFYACERKYICYEMRIDFPTRNTVLLVILLRLHKFFTEIP